MFGIGETEFVIILVFGFLLFGPDRLPGMGRTIGRALRQFRQAQEGFTEVVQTEVMDPLQQAMNDPEALAQKTAARSAALDEDADLEDGAPAQKKAETFAERKARLEAERKAREAEAAAAEATADVDDGADSDADAGAPAAEPPAPAEEQKPDTSAAALYAMKPKKSAQQSADSDSDADAEEE